MERVPLSSSNLQSVGYDSETGILEIEFKTGSIYQYSGVPTDEYLSMMNAPSQGRYFNANIKNRYPCIKL